MFFMAPSCVPGLTAGDLKKIAGFDESIIGLGEVMDYNAVLRGEPDMVKKLRVFRGCIADGHAPGLAGNDLNAYCANGIATDHECSTAEEALEKLRLGMYIQVREGSAAKNLDEIIRGLLRRKTGFSRCVFCTDDKHLGEIREKGHIDYNIRRAVELGVSPAEAICMGTINAAQCYNLRGLGAIAPGYRADLILLKDLDTFEIDSVFAGGRPLSELTDFSLETPDYCGKAVCNTVNAGRVSADDLRIPMRDTGAAIIKTIPGQILTKKIIAEVRVADGLFVPDERYAKLVVVERHRATGNVGLGIVEGFGIVNGAIASTVSHDAHNIVAAGDNDRDILIAIEELKRAGGGFTAVRGGRVIETLELPIAGLMSGRSAADIEKSSKSIRESAFTVCKNTQTDPFMSLSFLSLTAIPEIRLTDEGLYDVGSARYISIG
jgi:adenine deaminase